MGVDLHHNLQDNGLNLLNLLILLNVVTRLCSSSKSLNVCSLRFHLVIGVVCQHILLDVISNRRDLVSVQLDFFAL